MFAAVKLFLMKKLKEVTDKKKTSLLKTIDEKLTAAARELGLSLEQRTVRMKQRDKKVVTKTFHGAGLVVPVDKNDVGYRELPETDGRVLCGHEHVLVCGASFLVLSRWIQFPTPPVVMGTQALGSGRLELKLGLQLCGLSQLYNFIKPCLPSITW